MIKKIDKKTILIFSTARSGSTWLAGLLASPFRYRLLFEPFHPENVPGASLVADHYFHPDAIPEEAGKFIHSALTDQIECDWIAQSSNRRLNMHRWRWWPKVCIIKCIRGNLLIPVLRNLYNNQLPIIVLVRHPGAVVESMLRVNFPWTYDLSTLFEQDQFFETYNLPVDLFLQNIHDPVGQLTTRWLIENLYLFNHADQLGIKLLFYEDLIRDPVGQVTQLCEEFELKVYDKLDEKVNKPSYTTHPRSPVKKGEIKANSWQTRMKASDVEKIEKILDSVGFKYPR